MGEYIIADFANWAWVRIYHWSGFEIEDLARLNPDEKTVAKADIGFPTKIDV